LRLAGGWLLAGPAQEAGDGEGGYAREMSDDWHASARAMLTEQMAEVDVIISTALVPGKRAPLMVTATMIARMRRGSVTVDLAAANGGNIETTVMDEAIVTPNGVTCLGFTNLNSRLADTSSTLFARNQAAFLLSIGPWSTKVKGVFSIEHGDRVVRNMLCVELGELRYPPPALPPRVLPAKPAADTVPRVEAARRPARAAPEWERYAVGALHALLVCALVFVLGFFSPADSFSGMLSTLALATYIGYKVVQGVIPAFHSPLMAVSRALARAVRALAPRRSARFVSPTHPHHAAVRRAGM
jgi:NAD(P) transhydrogenase